MNYPPQQPPPFGGPPGGGGYGPPGGGGGGYGPPGGAPPGGAPPGGGGYGPPGGGGYGPPGGGGYGPPGGGGYGPPAGPPGGYQPPIPGGMGPGGPQNEMLAIVSLICGLVSLPLSFCCTFFSLPLQIIAIVCGGLALSKISKSNGALKGKEMAVIGIILGSITIVLMIILVAFGVGGAVLQEIMKLGSGRGVLSDAAARFAPRLRS